MGARGFAALLGERRFRVLAGLGVARDYRRGEPLVRQGDPGGFLLVLTAGRVRVNALDVDGAELLLALRAPGDLIGEMGLRAGSRRTATVRALEPVSARYLSEDVFQRFLAEHRAEGALRDYLVSKLSETGSYQLRLVHFPPLRRVARLLLEVVALAEPGDRAVPFAQEELARCLGMARSTVVEQLKLLRDDGALTPSGPLAVADLKALSRHAGVDV